MGVIKAIATLINAFPALAKFLERLNSTIKEKNARERYERKADAIDAAVRAANSRMSARSVRWSEQDAGSSAVSSGVQGSTTIHDGSSQEAGGV